jgi:toxin ParE1/3/4
MQIRWSPEAADDLERIVQHIQKDNPEAARTVAETIYEGASSLKTFPNRGRIGRHRGSRELIFEPYILVYRVSGEFVEISRVYHAAQDRPFE